MQYETYILSLMTEERLTYINKTCKLFPFVKIFNSVNGYNKEETIKEFLSLGINFHKLKKVPKMISIITERLHVGSLKLNFLSFKFQTKFLTRFSLKMMLSFYPVFLMHLTIK